MKDEKTPEELLASINELGDMVRRSKGFNQATRHQTPAIIASAGFIAIVVGAFVFFLKTHKITPLLGAMVIVIPILCFGLISQARTIHMFASTFVLYQSAVKKLVDAVTRWDYNTIKDATESIVAHREKMSSLLKDMEVSTGEDKYDEAEKVTSIMRTNIIDMGNEEDTTTHD